MPVHDPSISHRGARVRDASTGQHSSIDYQNIDFWKSISKSNRESSTRTLHANGESSVDAKHGGETSATTAIERRTWWGVFDDDDVGETKSARWCV